MKIEINHHSLFYLDQGNKNGLPIIFVHGFPLDHTMWDQQVAGLPAEYRYIAYDVRGHGQSAPGKNSDFTVKGFGHDLTALIDHLKIDKCILCGLSMGGYIVMNALPDVKEKVAGLILCDTKAEGDTKEGKEKRMATIRKIKIEGLEKFSEAFVDGLLSPSNKDNQVLRNQLLKMIQGNYSDNICKTLQALADRDDASSVLKKMDIPALIIVGEHDTITPLPFAENLKKLLKGSVLKVIPNAGHMSNLENTEEFNRVVSEFVAGTKNKAFPGRL
jgi:3-oxoadipate enol-lactonase